VQLEADIELGGTDQIFNLLVGRDIQKDFNQAPQVVMTMPLMEGTDGKQKMSKSLGNYIGIDEAAQEMFGKLMSISDELMWKYYTLLTDEDPQSAKSMHPKEAKLYLAELIVAQYHGKKQAAGSREEFQQVFGQKELPSVLPVYELKNKKSDILNILLDSGLIASKNEARRLIKQGGVYLDGKRLDEETAVIEQEGVLKVGKRRFLRIKT
jgi:tyrosyl-tRNA synthetase